MGNSINDIHIEDFQSVVGDLLMRNRSILDIISKIQTSGMKSSSKKAYDFWELEFLEELLRRKTDIR